MVVSQSYLSTESFRLKSDLFNFPLRTSGEHLHWTRGVTGAWRVALPLAAEPEVGAGLPRLFPPY